MLLKRILVCFLILIAIQVYAKQREIVIATLEYPPFIYSEENQVKGPIVDKINDVFGKMGVRVNIQMLSIARGLLMVENGEVDAYFSLKKTPEREKKLLFTKVPLIKQPFVFFANIGSSIEWNGDVNSIKKYRIGVVSKTSYGKIFDGYVKDNVIANIDESRSFELNIKKLIAGRVDLVINSYDVGKYLLDKYDAGSKIVSLNPPVEIVNSYLAFTKVRNYTDLANQFDIILCKDNSENVL
ncbi:MAG: transporter substrate-binding domain-containing protein [Desulfobulbus sp.]|nr:transporter substrate-binding domain-containing protein [Desulfobulbus sp.]